MAEIFTPDNLMVREFGRTIDLLQQQLDRRLVPAVRNVPITAEFMELDQLDTVELADLLTRHQDTHTVDATHKRRVVKPIPASAAILVDPSDLRRVMADPQMAYQNALAAGSNRKHDRRINSAFFATAVTGKGSSGTAAFDSTNYQIAAGAVGLTVTKLRTAHRMLLAAENPKDMGANQWFIAATATQIVTDLLATTEVTSSDFNTVKALAQGQINEFLGFTFIHYEGLSLSTTSRSCAAWRKGSMCIALSLEGRVSIRPRPDKEDATQIRYENDSGATRMDEKGVVEVICTE